ncbi:hypothetical protein PHAVU_004G135500 [Phaseolus vulgaris]|uniref:Uncharacterized protein n=1 Tax=Phaseolus vulgaris TaxID=3885 RepID=V7C5D4_PHAVU|nr:hypothetical protein PHAVU_004G135500g [Phaseolus vulgaris]ESW24495.1 hypothetical protein PHAVU_004G135500g [Phaseolus vulgaris]
MPSSTTSSYSSSSYSTSSFTCFSATSPSNLQRFLQCVTPHVPSQTLPKSSFTDLNPLWQPLGKDKVEFFTLQDLWDRYYEWSAYGAGTPVTLEDGETVTQYYVPYLSAIQIYSNKSVAASRNRREDCDGVEFESDSWSEDSSSDNLSRSLSNNSSKAWEDAVSEDSCCEQEGSWLRDNKLGYLYLQYTEMASPYSRVPLAEKIDELARTHPALLTLKSVDLSPASWMAVSWYPIYTVPSRNNEKELEACFLTYHTLSSSFEDCAMECDVCCLKNQGENGKKQNSEHVSLLPFGLATYKMQGDVWLNTDPYDNESISCLYSAADSWLKQLNVHHHDFNFFTLHSTM